MCLSLVNARRKAGIPASNRRARCGAVAFIQRFSDALNLDPHFHVLALGMALTQRLQATAFRAME